MITRILLFALAGALIPTTFAAEKPNFVLIFIDDMGYGDVRPYGSTGSKRLESR